MRTKLSFSGYFFCPIGPMSLEFHGGSGRSMSIGPRLSGGSTRVSVTHSFPVAPPPPLCPMETKPILGLGTLHLLQNDGVRAPESLHKGLAKLGDRRGFAVHRTIPRPPMFVSLVVSIVVESTREIGCVQSNVFFLWAHNH